MKKIKFFSTYILLLIVQFIYGQNQLNTLISANQDKRFYFESGINISLPVHIHMYRTHRLAIGINTRIWKKIATKSELGIKIDYDYRFIKKNSLVLNSESTIIERALNSNYSLICIKPNAQFNLKYNWYLGLETGIGYALSEADSKIGLGFISEYDGPQQFGLCSGLYIGKHFIMGSKKKEFGLSLDLTQFLAHGHAENSLGIKTKYLFN